MPQLDNCPRCGKLFVRTVRPICNDCQKEIDEQFKLVYDYLRKKENRQATIYEVSENTGVSVAQIKQFIREGRLIIRDLPNMGYPCESCGEIIREGRMCVACRKKFQGVAEKLTQEFVEDRQRSGPKEYVFFNSKRGYRHLKEDEKEALKRKGKGAGDER